MSQQPPSCSPVCTGVLYRDLYYPSQRQISRRMGDPPQRGVRTSQAFVLTATRLMGQVGRRATARSARPHLPGLLHDETAHRGMQSCPSGQAGSEAGMCPLLTQRICSVISTESNLSIVLLVISMISKASQAQSQLYRWFTIHS